MAETRSKTIWWWPWQTDRIEAVLEGMAAEGWRLIRARYACSRFVFERQAPAKVRYCVDYQEKEKPEYLTLLRDAGWRLEYKGSGWYIWSKAYADVKPELFTDVDSLIRRNNMILGSLTAVLASQVPLIVVNMNNFAAKSPVGLGFMVFWALLEAVMAGMVVGMALGNRKLKRRKAEK